MTCPETHHFCCRVIALTWQSAAHVAWLLSLRPRDCSISLQAVLTRCGLLTSYAGLQILLVSVPLVASPARLLFSTRKNESSLHFHIPIERRQCLTSALAAYA